VLLAEAFELCAAGDRAVLVHRERNRTGRCAPGEPGEVDHGLRPPRALKDPARAGAQRKDRPGTNEVAGTLGRVDGRQDRAGLLFGGGAAPDGIRNGDRDRRLPLVAA
jgi:hypothetical protein